MLRLDSLENGKLIHAGYLVSLVGFVSHALASSYLYILLSIFFVACAWVFVCGLYPPSRRTEFGQSDCRRFYQLNDLGYRSCRRSPRRNFFPAFRLQGNSFQSCCSGHFRFSCFTKFLEMILRQRIAEIYNILTLQLCQNKNLKQNLIYGKVSLCT